MENLAFDPGPCGVSATRAGGARCTEAPMARKMADFIKNAEECRRLARILNMPEHRESLIEMAVTWERLAVERDRTSPRRTGVPFVSSWPENK